MDSQRYMDPQYPHGMLITQSICERSLFISPPAILLSLHCQPLNNNGPHTTMECLWPQRQHFMVTSQQMWILICNSLEQIVPCLSQSCQTIQWATSCLWIKWPGCKCWENSLHLIPWRDNHAKRDVAVTVMSIRGDKNQYDQWKPIKCRENPSSWSSSSCTGIRMSLGRVCTFWFCLVLFILLGT